MVQWLRSCPPIAEDPGSIPSQGGRSWLPQLKGPMCPNKNKRYCKQKRSIAVKKPNICTAESGVFLPVLQRSSPLVLINPMPTFILYTMYISRNNCNTVLHAFKLYNWLIHVNVWQKPLQYCKVVSLQ